MARLPSRRELESMYPHNAAEILQIHARQCMQTIHVYGHQSPGPSTFSVDQNIKRECGKLYRIYKLANELGIYAGQPDYQYTRERFEPAYQDDPARAA